MELAARNKTRPHPLRRHSRGRWRRRRRRRRKVREGGGGREERMSL